MRISTASPHLLICTKEGSEKFDYCISFNPHSNLMECVLAHRSQVEVIKTQESKHLTNVSWPISGASGPSQAEWLNDPVSSHITQH